jgi:Fe-S-cluster containining protein
MVEPRYTPESFCRLQEAWAKGQLCLLDICKGFCCEHVSEIVKVHLQEEGLRFDIEGNEFRCKDHNRDTGLCERYESRPEYCQTFFCPSVKRGFMRQVMIDRGLITDG